MEINIKRLLDGTYELNIDGKRISTGTAEEMVSLATVFHNKEIRDKIEEAQNGKL